MSQRSAFAQLAGGFPVVAVVEAVGLVLPSIFPADPGIPQLSLYSRDLYNNVCSRLFIREKTNAGKNQSAHHLESG